MTLSPTENVVYVPGFYERQQSYVNSEPSEVVPNQAPVVELSEQGPAREVQPATVTKNGVEGSNGGEEADLVTDVTESNEGGRLSESNLEPELLPINDPISNGLSPIKAPLIVGKEVNAMSLNREAVDLAKLFEIKINEIDEILNIPSQTLVFNGYSMLGNYDGNNSHANPSRPIMENMVHDPEVNAPPTSKVTGFLVEWDFFLELINPVASQIAYMTAIGNHERDYVESGSVYLTPDSGGECGVAYETYFPMPTSAKDKPWYSIEQARIHFTIISTEHDWSVNSEQYLWMEEDMGSVNRSKTPWLIFMGHRPMYTSSNADTSVDPQFVNAVEPLLLQYKVDLVLFGHVHNYERTCAVYQGKCKAMPTKDANGVDTYNNSNYSAPVQAVIGMAGFSLDKFTTDVRLNTWDFK
nr:putative inactive purple acid phosphatase 27 [Quercus suber]